MNNSTLFKQAHTMAKAIHVKGRGESYSVTFGACLKLLKGQSKAKQQKKLSVEFVAMLVLCMVIVVAIPLKLLSDVQALTAIASALIGYVLDPFLMFNQKNFANDACKRIEPVL